MNFFSNKQMKSESNDRDRFLAVHCCDTNICNGGSRWTSSAASIVVAILLLRSFFFFLYWFLSFIRLRRSLFVISVIIHEPSPWKARQLKKEVTVSLALSYVDWVLNEFLFRRLIDDCLAVFLKRRRRFNKWERLNRGKGRDGCKTEQMKCNMTMRKLPSSRFS